MSTEDTYQKIMKNGWAPAPWSHHPQAIKDLIRGGGFRPKVKGCFENCGKLIIASLKTEYEKDLIYCEGWAVGYIPTEHAWIKYKGEIVDLTTQKLKHGECREYTPHEVVIQMVQLGHFGPFSDLSDLSPLRDEIEAFRKLQQSK